MTSFLDLILPETESNIRSTIKGYAETAGDKISNWRVGGVGQQVFEMAVAATYAFSAIVSTYVRGFASLDTSVDPGDEDPYDSNNVALDPVPGLLSAYGENVYGTPRIAQTFATGSVTFTNAGAVARTIAPYGLTFTWTVTPPAGAPPTYRNIEDASIYTDPGGTVTVGVGASIVLPVSCDEIGSRGSCPSGSVTLTTTLNGCSATNADPISGNDREDAASYRIRCRNAASRLSLGGPSACYQYLANTNLDGTPLLNGATPPVQSGITRTWVSQSSSTGIVNAYYASASGAAIDADVTAANLNIEQQAFAVPDAITFTGAAAVETNVHVVGSVRIANSSGLDTAAIKAAIVAALAAEWQTFPIGGFDQDGGGNGVIYTSDIEAIARTAYAGLYNCVVSTPSGSSTAITAGHVATLTSAVADWTVTVV